MGRTFKALTRADLIAINRSMIDATGGEFFEYCSNLIQPGSLEYILEAVRADLFNDLYPTIPAKAAFIGHRIIQGHIFYDGNKRTGMQACFTFLDINNYDMRIDRDVVAVAVRVATNDMSINEFLSWLNDRVSERD